MRHEVQFAKYFISYAKTKKVQTPPHLSTSMLVWWSDSGIACGSSGVTRSCGQVLMVCPAPPQWRQCMTRRFLVDAPDSLCIAFVLPLEDDTDGIWQASSECPVIPHLRHISDGFVQESGKWPTIPHFEQINWGFRHVSSEWPVSPQFPQFSNRFLQVSPECPNKPQLLHFLSLWNSPAERILFSFDRPAYFSWNIGRTTNLDASLALRQAPLSSTDNMVLDKHPPNSPY